MYITNSDPDPVVPEKYLNLRKKAWDKVRKTWDINPVERVVPNKKKKGLKVNKEKHKNSWRAYDEEDY